MSIHLLPDARPPFAPLLKHIFTPSSIPNSIAVILLDWAEPWNWLSQLRERISILKSVLDSLDNDCKDIMDEVMRSWRERRAGPVIEGVTPAFVLNPQQQSSAPPPPLGPGEWDDPLGISICIVCLNAENTHILAREHVWTDTQFDYILQHLRAVLLRHGGSLVYTSSTQASNAILIDLIRSSLSIQSLLKKTVLRPEAIKRDGIMIPPNWDTAGKIKTLDASFDVEAIGADWSREIAASMEQIASQPSITSLSLAPTGTEVLPRYSRKIQDPNQHFTHTDTESATDNAPPKPRPNLQEFLASQLPILRSLEAEDAEAAASGGTQSQQQALLPQETRDPAILEQNLPTRPVVSRNPTPAADPEPVAPMLMNVGGVHVDVEAAVKELRERAALGYTNNDNDDLQDNEQTRDDGGGQQQQSVDEAERKLEWISGLANRRKTGGSRPSTPQR